MILSVVKTMVNNLVDKTYNCSEALSSTHRIYYVAYSKWIIYSIVVENKIHFVLNGTVPGKREPLIIYFEVLR